MTQEEILDYNRRCAEFLGCVEHSYPSSMGTPFHGRRVWMSPTSSDGKTRTFYCVVGEEHFHSDWNWIMEICEAIEDIQIKEQYIYSVQPRGSACEIKCSTQYSLAFDNEMPCIYEIAKSKKEAVVQAINQFLIWYNENKS